MTEEVAEQMSLDADSLIEDAAAVVQSDVPQDSSDIVSKAFTSVEGDNSEVQYVTMTPEEAAAAGVVEDEQVVTTSLQFDPANPSVLYTADGTIINQSDLSPEEQALVQAALQQHLAEQEAEQQLAMIDQSATENEKPVAADGSENGVTSTNLLSQSSTNGAEPVATITATGDSSNAAATSVNLASPNTNASQIVQTLANNVRRQQEYMKAQQLLNQVKQQEIASGYSRFEEKIVIRQGQPQVVKVPVRTPAPKKPEIPAALANLMPKIEIGKDGSQVIRIHQSQITADQLKSLQENPNVRLVFRPASSSKSQSRPNIPGMPSTGPRKRGRPRKNLVSPAIINSSYEQQMDDSSPPSKTRYGRMTKQPYYSKDYASPGNGEIDDGDEDYRLPSLPSLPRPQHVPGRRGRPPGSFNRSTLDKQGFKRSNSYAYKIEALREQEEIHDDDVTTARLAINSQKPVLSSVEQAISTRRKNRLRELLSACSEDEIMEVALPHLARVFSLWEFLVMKVEKNKLSRVYFADVYKEYEALHKYVCRLTEKYKETISAQKVESDEKNDSSAVELDAKEALDKNKKSIITVRCRKLADSLGLDQNELEDAVITLLDSEPLQRSSAVTTSNIKQNSIVSTSSASQSTTVAEPEIDDSNKPVQTEVSSTNSPAVATTASGNAEQSDMPALAPIDSDSTTAQKEGNSTPADAMEVDQSTSNEQTGDTKQQQEEAQVVTNLAEGHTVIAPSSDTSQIIQIGTGDDKQFIEVPEGYTLIQTPEGLVMSQPGTTLSQAEDGTIYVTQEDGTTAPLDSQKGVPLETVESLLSLDGQQQQQEPQEQQE